LGSTCPRPAAAHAAAGGAAAGRTSMRAARGTARGTAAARAGTPSAPSRCTRSARAPAAGGPARRTAPSLGMPPRGGPPGGACSGRRALCGRGPAGSAAGACNRPLPINPHCSLPLSNQEPGGSTARAARGRACGISLSPSACFTTALTCCGLSNAHCQYGEQPAGCAAARLEPGGAGTRRCFRLASLRL